MKIPNMLQIYEEFVFNSNTKYVQFILFNINPEDVLVYSIKSLKNNHILSKSYIAFFSSFLVRRNMSDDLIRKAISYFF